MKGRLGLSISAEAIYRAILLHRHADLESLRALVDLGEEELREGLEELTALSLVRISAGSPSRLHAVSPRLAGEILVSRQRAELADAQRRLERSRVAAASLAAEFTEWHTARTSARMGHLCGSDSIRDYLVMMNDSVEKELLVFDLTDPGTESATKAYPAAHRRLAERGVEIRTVCLDSVRDRPATAGHAAWLLAHGGQLRTAPALPARMMVFDRRTALLGTEEGAAAGAVTLRGRSLVASLSTLFDLVWQTAEPMGPPAAESAGELTRRQHVVLRLLSLGHTDESIARRIGVSPRTARRISTELMELLGAESRFQSGVRAVQRGYLPATAE